MLMNPHVQHPMSTFLRLQVMTWLYSNKSLSNIVNKKTHVENTKMDRYGSRCNILALVAKCQVIKTTYDPFETI